MKFFLISILSLLTFSSFAQLVTNGGMSASQLVQNVLLGQGVDVFNVSYSGSSQAIGTFNSTNANVGITEGIIMTTGTISSNAQGPLGPNNSEKAGKDNNVSGYSKLSQLVGTNTYNAALLEFDFIPYSDTVRFKYVFASEEYLEYVGSQFNDVFAFFISGPGISGMKNMAIIPGTSLPVTINNVNHMQNTAYFQYNGDGNTAPYNSNPYYIQYDGFTKPLEAVSKVQCGETYHLVIAIADVGDAIYDSGIFLEKNSLNSIQPVQVSYHLVEDPYGDGVTMAQGCSSAIVTVTRSGNNINQPLTIPINISGTAIQGLDYSSIPTSIYFAPGQTTVSFTINALSNPGLTGTVNILLKFLIEDPCGNEEYQTVELFIKPLEPVTVTVDDVEKMCKDDEVILTANALGGGGSYTYQWSTNETTPEITVNPTSTQTYTVSVTDDCLNQTVSATATVTVPVLAPLTINLTPDITEQCPFIEHDLVVEAMGGAGDYTYLWIDGNGKKFSIDPSVTVKTGTTTTYMVYVTDKCGEMDSAAVTITILSPPLLLDITPKQQICPGDSVQLTVYPTGGFGNYYYFWPHSGETTASVWVNPTETTRYNVIVKDDCQTFQVSTYTTVVVVQPTADFAILTNPKFEDLPITFENMSEGGNTYYWDFGDGSTSSDIHPNNVYTDTGTYIITLIVEDVNGCRDTITKPIRILEEFYLYIPNSFSPDGNRFNNTFKVSAIGVVDFQIRIFNRWGELLFEAKDVNFEWDGIYDNKMSRDGTYVWKIDYRSIHDVEDQHIVGHVNLLR